jgi:hypothetical protein
MYEYVDIVDHMYTAFRLEKQNRLLRATFDITAAQDCEYMCMYIYIYIYIYIHIYISVSKHFLRCPTPRLHCFLSSHWPSFRFLSVMAFLVPSIQFFFGLPRALLCFGIHFNAILGNLPSAILWTWPYHVSWFCSISFLIVFSSPICCLIVTFLILSFFWYSRGSPQSIHFCSFDPFLIYTVYKLYCVPYVVFKNT